MKKDVRWYHVGAASALGVVVGCLLALNLGQVWWLGLLGGPLVAFIFVDVKTVATAVRKAFSKETLVATPAFLLEGAKKTGNLAASMIRLFNLQKLCFIALLEVYIVTMLVGLGSPLICAGFFDLAYGSSYAYQANNALTTYLTLLVFLGALLGMMTIFWVFLKDSAENPIITYARGSEINWKKVWFASFFPLIFWCLILRSVFISILIGIGKCSTNARLSAVFGTLAGMALALAMDLAPFWIVISSGVGFVSGSLAFIFHRKLSSLEDSPVLPRFCKG